MFALKACALNNLKKLPLVIVDTQTASKEYVFPSTQPDSLSFYSLYRCKNVMEEVVVDVAQELLIEDYLSLQYPAMPICLSA